MTALDNTPNNRNFLSPFNFKFTIKKAPNVNFFVQKANIAAMQLQDATAPTPFVRNPSPGDHINFGTLDITFKVDEDMQNYLEIHTWLKGLGFNHDFGQYKAIQDTPAITGDGIYSDISLMILTNAKQPNYEVIYVDAFPVSISGFSFNTTNQDVNYIEASASFRYTYYDIIKVNSKKQDYVA